jgi:hypothetical protein
MKAVYVEPKKTPMTFAEAHTCMKWALQTHIGKIPSDEVLALALAKTALETGKWTSIWNSNWGNVKAQDTYEGMYTCITLNECLTRQGKTITVWFSPEGELSGPPSKGGSLISEPLVVPPGHAQTHMRAFANNYDGVDCYVSFVATGRYKAAWMALLKGDAAAYVHALKAAGYFTAPEDVYTKSVVAIQKEMLAKIRNQAPPPKIDLEWQKLKDLVPTLQFDLVDLIDSEGVQDFPQV